MKKIILIVGLIVLGIVAPAAGQTQKPTPTPTPPPGVGAANGIKVDIKGSFDGSVYRNPGLGFSVTAPAGWQAQDTETQAQFADKASTSANSRETSSGAKASLARTNLLFILVRPTETATNPMVIGMSEDIALAFNVRTPQQYLMAARKAGESTILQFDSYTTTEKINGIEFGWMGATAKGGNIYQRYYVTLRNHNAIGFVLTFHTEEELGWCLEVLRSFKFD